jgi:twitching motility two-component system response regulator PilH
VKLRSEATSLFDPPEADKCLLAYGEFDGGRSMFDVHLLYRAARHKGGYIMGKTVLVVDDDPDVRLFSVTVLEEHGYTPLEAANGEEGLKMIKEHKPDLIILDVLMPRQSGIRLYRELKTDKRLKNIEVIILSGIAKKTFLRSQKALTEFGGKEVPEPKTYLEKPVEPEVLAAAIEKALS